MLVLWFGIILTHKMIEKGRCFVLELSLNVKRIKKEKKKKRLVLVLFEIILKYKKRIRNKTSLVLVLWF